MGARCEFIAESRRHESIPAVERAQDLIDESSCCWMGVQCKRVGSGDVHRANDKATSLGLA
jgi:hypothetical protein